jgi:YfiH family protein
MFDTASDLLAVEGLVHGFTDRAGGVSEGRFASLNMASKWGDDPAAVEENLRRLGAAAGFAPGQLRRARQVHGTAVVWAHEVDDQTEADAVCCRRGDRLVAGVLTADCVPIVLADRAGTVAAAVHSGWRGTVGDIAGATVGALVSAGVAAADLVAAVGPCIEAPAFEVGDEVAAQFPPQFVVRTAGARPHVDLVAAVIAQLVDAGLEDTSIERVGGCTHAHPDRWFSYRRDGAGIGQMLAFVGWP